MVIMDRSKETILSAEEMSDAGNLCARLPVMTPTSSLTSRLSYPSEVRSSRWLWSSVCEYCGSEPSSLGFWELAIDRSFKDSSQQTKLDVLWNSIEQLVAYGVLYDACCMTGRSKAPGKILCYTKDVTDTENVKKIAEVIKHVTNYEGLMFYYKKVTSGTAKGREKRNKKVPLYMFYYNIFLISDKRGWKPVLLDAGKWELYFDNTSFHTQERLSEMVGVLHLLVLEGVLTDVWYFLNKSKTEWVIACCTRNWRNKKEVVTAGDAIRLAVSYPWPMFYRRHTAFDEGSETKKDMERIYKHLMYKEGKEMYYRREFFVRNGSSWKPEFSDCIDLPKRYK